MENTIQEIQTPCQKVCAVFLDVKHVGEQVRQKSFLGQEVLLMKQHLNHFIIWNNYFTEMAKLIP